MSLFRVKVAIATDGAGAQTAFSPSVRGRIISAFLQNTGTLTGAGTIVITEEDTTAAILSTTVTALSTTSPLSPQTQVHDQAGAAVGTTKKDQVVVGRIKIVIAGGGATKTGTLWLYLDGDASEKATAGIN